MSTPKPQEGLIHRWRHLFLRRISQVATLLLFFGTAHWGWSLFGQPLLLGNLSASDLAGLFPMADPFALLQILATGAWPITEVLIGALIVLGFYAILGGRVFCAWVCPVNLVTDAAAWLRRRLGVRDVAYLPRSTKYVSLGLALLLSAATGLTAFEVLSPIGMAHRELIYGLGMGLTALLGIFLFDLILFRHGWCGHLCPLGAFYSLLGRTARIRIHYHEPSCTHCMECVAVCPEPQVLNLKKMASAGLVASGDCSNCGRCIPACPEGSLGFGLRGGATRTTSLAVDSNSQKETTIPQRRNIP